MLWGRGFLLESKKKKKIKKPVYHLKTLTTEKPLN